MEIGGYYGLEQNEDYSYHKNAIRLNSGRNCLRVLIRNRQIKRIYLPYYICDAVIEVCHLENCQINFYFIGKDFRLKSKIVDFDIGKDYLYLVNYAGFLTKEEILNYQKFYQNIILDNTQAFFMKQIPGIDIIYSCRKFFGVPDGAYLYTSIEIIEKYGYDSSYDRMRHILGRYELGGERFYESYKKNEEKFSSMPILHMSKLTDNMMRIIDYTNSMLRRGSNYNLLYKRLAPLNKLEIPEWVDGAFSYPLLLDSAEKIRERLRREKIFIPKYWREVLGREGILENTVEYQYTQNILWIPCDQRYTEVEMNYLVDRIRRILGL